MTDDCTGKAVVLVTLGVGWRSHVWLPILGCNGSWRGLRRGPLCHGSGRMVNKLTKPSLHFGPRLGIERRGKINAVHSGSESWTGIGVVAGCAAVWLITQGPHVKGMAVHERSTFLHILQEVRGIGKTRNHLFIKTRPSGWASAASRRRSVSVRRSRRPPSWALRMRFSSWR